MKTLEKITNRYVNFKKDFIDLKKEFESYNLLIIALTYNFKI